MLHPLLQKTTVEQAISCRLQGLLPLNADAMVCKL